MKSRNHQKWKSIIVFDKDTKKTICFELDNDERLIKIDYKSKRISKTTKQKSITSKISNDISTGLYNEQQVKFELTKNTTIFSRESNIDQYMLNNCLDGNSQENSQNINNFRNEDFNIIDFDQVNLMVHDEYEDWDDFNLFS